MAFHACPRETQVAAAPVDRPLVCAINHEKDRERDGRTTVIVMQPFAYERPSTGVCIWVPAAYVMHAAVTGFGSGGYDRAAETWSQSFMDWRTGEWLPPLAKREAFFRDGDPEVIKRIRNQPPINCAP